ncbi:MAG: bifunctional oligoribonuclease/PAP phosphatase NrnA [bacterium]
MNAPFPFDAGFQALVSTIENNQRFLVVSHVHPDGDAVGSTLSMGLVLERLGKDVVFYNEHEIPYNFRFLPGADRWVQTVPEGEYDVTVVLDCGEPHRVGDMPRHGWGTTIAVVDHHKTFDPTFAQVYLQDTQAAATGELIFKIAEYFGVMDADIAQNLYCCLVTDTGSFRYSNTSQQTFTMAGSLVAAGVNPWSMTSQIYESQPRERLMLLGRVLSTLEFSPCGRLAFLTIQASDFPPNTDLALIDGFINYARSIQGVEVATQLMESEDGWRISFRSRGSVDVSKLASRFGGGGHHNAAGCSVSGTAEQVRQNLSEALVAMLDA